MPKKPEDGAADDVRTAPDAAPNALAPAANPTPLDAPLVPKGADDSTALLEEKLKGAEDDAGTPNPPDPDPNPPLLDDGAAPAEAPAPKPLV